MFIMGRKDEILILLVLLTGFAMAQGFAFLIALASRQILPFNLPRQWSRHLHSPTPPPTEQTHVRKPSYPTTMVPAELTWK